MTMMVMTLTLKLMMLVMLSQVVMMVFNRKKLDVCVYLMSAVAVQMEVKHQDNQSVRIINMIPTCISWIRHFVQVEEGANATVTDLVIFSLALV